PCTREEYDGPGRSARCDKRLPYPIRYRPDALLNPAVFHDAMPGSTIKPIMAAAFLSDPAVGAGWLSAERAELARAPTALRSTENWGHPFGCDRSRSSTWQGSGNALPAPTGSD